MFGRELNAGVDCVAVCNGDANACSATVSAEFLRGDVAAVLSYKMSGTYRVNYIVVLGR